MIGPGASAIIEQYIGTNRRLFNSKETRMGKISASLTDASIALDRSAATPLHRQLYDQLRDAILSGRLAPGARLLSTRELAGVLGIGRNTVINAFDQLHAESYLERRVGDGTYVSRQLPDDLLRAKSDCVAWRGSKRNVPSLSRWGAVAVATPIGPGEYKGRPRPFRTSVPALDAFPYKLWGKLLARRWNPRLIYVAPSHQYPLGMTLTLSRRLALLEIASKAGAWIIEDDYDSEFRYVGRPLAALQGLDTEQRVIYVGTLSKVLFPSICIGYIIAPPDLFDALVVARSLAGRQSPTLEQAALADFICQGHFARHIRKMRALYAERRQALLNAGKRELEGLLDIQRSDAGMHLIGWLQEGTNDRAASAAAFAVGVEVTPLSAYSIEPQQRGALRLGYTGYTSREISHATRRLATALRSLNSGRK